MVYLYWKFLNDSKVDEVSHFWFSISLKLNNFMLDSHDSHFNPTRIIPSFCLRTSEHFLLICRSFNVSRFISMLWYQINSRPWPNTKKSKRQSWCFIISRTWKLLIIWWVICSFSSFAPCRHWDILLTWWKVRAVYFSLRGSLSSSSFVAPIHL